MKFFPSLLLALVVFATSCTKNNPVTVTKIDTITVTVRDTVHITDTARSNFDFLTAHTWMYNSYYIGYVSPTNLGTLQYQRGASGNLMSFDNARTTYNPDGTITEIDQNGSSTPGTWVFGNNLETIVSQHNATGTYNATIVKIDSTHFTWYYTAIDATVRYGEYIIAH